MLPPGGGVYHYIKELHSVCAQGYTHKNIKDLVDIFSSHLYAVYLQYFISFW